MTILTSRMDRIDRADNIAAAFEERYPECRVRIDYAFDSLNWIFLIARPEQDVDVFPVTISEEDMADDSIDVLGTLVRAYDPGAVDLIPYSVVEEDVATIVNVQSVYGQNPVDVLNIREGQRVFDAQGNVIGTIVSGSVEVRNDMQPLYRAGDIGPIQAVGGWREMRINLELVVTNDEIAERALNASIVGYVRGEQPVVRRTPEEAKIQREKVLDVLENKPEGFSIAEFFDENGTV